MFLSVHKFLKAATVIVSCFFLFACENDMNEVRELGKQKNTVEEGKNIEGYLSQTAKMKAKLTAPLMRRYITDSPYIEFPNTLHVDFFNEASTVDSRLDARYGKYLEMESKVFLKDSVKVINIKGDTLYCDELWWDRNRKGSEFYTELPVRIRTKTQIIDGVGMEASQDFKSYVIKKVTGILNVTNSQFPVY